MKRKKYIRRSCYCKPSYIIIFNYMPTLPTRRQCEFLMWQNKSPEILTTLCSNAMPNVSFVKVTVTPCRQLKSVLSYLTYRDADKSLARPGRKQARKDVRDARDFNKIETRAAIKFLFLQGKAPKEIHAILTETLILPFLVGLRTYQHPCIPPRIIKARYSICN